MNKVTLSDLKELAQNAQGNISHLYLHWSAGHYTSYFDDYHVNIAGDGSIYVSCESLEEHKSHTYMRNTGAVGIALACCAGATSDNLGTEPPTDAQIETMAQVIAVLCEGLGLPIDVAHVQTHGEAGDNIDGLSTYAPYGQNTTCERWDLAILKNGDTWSSGGDTLRGKAIYYENQGGC